MGDLWYLIFTRWYIGLFLIGYGLYLGLRSRQLNDLARYFKKSERTPALEAAIARRQSLESIPLAVWYAPGVVNVVLGVAVLTGLLPGIIGYGLGVCAFAGSVGIAYLRIRNRGTRRAAALQPRTLTSVVPIAWYPAAAVVSVAPLAFVDAPGHAIAAICVCITSVATFGFAIASNNMASIMSGEDPEREMLVDARLRCSRVMGLFAVGMGVPFVFVAMSSPALHGVLHLATFWFVVAAWCVFMLPLLLKVARNPGLAQP
jgi:hypothetical protein